MSQAEQILFFDRLRKGFNRAKKRKSEEGPVDLEALMEPTIPPPQK